MWKKKKKKTCALLVVLATSTSLFPLLFLSLPLLPPNFKHMEAKPLEHVPDLLPSMELAGKVEPIPGEYILQLTNSPMGYLVASTSTHSVLLMDPSTLTTVRQLQGHGAPVTDMVARDHLLLTSCEDGCVRVWDLRVQDLSGPMQVLQGES